MITTVKRQLYGEVQWNDGERASIKAIGIEGAEKDILLDSIVVSRKDCDYDSAAFRRHFRAGSFVEISKTLEFVQTRFNLPKASCDDAGRGIDLKLERARARAMLSWPVDQIRNVLMESENFKDCPTGSQGPMMAAAVVLVSAVLLRSTDTSMLVEFTGYGRNFISAINSNMTRSGRWVEDRYDAEYSLRWFSPTKLVVDQDAFFMEILIASGEEWEYGPESFTLEKPQDPWT